MAEIKEFVFTRKLAGILGAMPESERAAASWYAISYGLGAVPASEEPAYAPITREIDRANERNSPATKELCEEIVGWLNRRCHTQFSPGSQRTKGFLNARLREGFVKEDFFSVIDYKAEEWEGTEMRGYLRPETLFGAKFEGYLQAARADRAARKADRSFDTDEFYEAALRRTYGTIPG